jgi:hypothetical protein
MQRLENSMTTFDGAYASFKDDVYEAIKNQFVCIKTALISAGAIEITDKVEFGSEKLSFR